MKLRPHNKSAGRRHQRGSATLIVFALLGCMAIFIMANAITLHRLDRELRLIEKQQLRHYPAATNAPTAIRHAP